MNALKSPAAARPRRHLATRLLLPLFPRPWRGRYGDEFAALLDELGPYPSVIFDVLVAALDARLHPDQPARRIPVAERYRRSELAIFAAWVTLVVAGLAYSKLNEDNPFTAIRANDLLVGIAFDLVLVGAVAAFIGVVVAGLPIAVAIVLDGLQRHRPSQLGLLCVPLLSVGAWIAMTLLLVRLGTPSVDDLTRVILFALVAGGFVLAVALGAVALAVAALNAQIDAALYRRATRPAYMTVAGMVVVTAGAVAWGAALFLADGNTFWGDEGLLATSTALSWFVICAVMVVASVIAVRAARHLRAEAG